MVKVGSGNDHILKRVASVVNVKDFDRVYRTILNKTIFQRNGALGFAGNQVSMNENVFTAVIGGCWKVFINPIIVEKSDEAYNSVEECLSLPKEKPKVVKRHESIWLHYFKKSGDKWESVNELFTGLDAKIIQHEVDHLNGNTIADKEIRECK